MENAGPVSLGTGYGVPGCGKTWCGKRGLVENTGSGGKHGVWWKTRSLVENTESEWKTRAFSEKKRQTTGKPFFSPKYEFNFLTKMRSRNFVSLNCNEINSASRREMRFGQRRNST